jgi:hypothetical protein
MGIWTALLKFIYGKRFFYRYEIKLWIFFFFLYLSLHIIHLISKCGHKNLCHINYDEGITAYKEIKHVYKKYSMDENMTPLYSVYADVGIGHDILLYKCNTDIEYREFMDDLYKHMEK